MRYPDPIFSHRFNKWFKQVSKTTARKAYGNGKTVYLLPSNCVFDNFWVYPCPISTESKVWNGMTFDYQVAEYKFYNCCADLGKYPLYFIEVA